MKQTKIHRVLLVTFALVACSGSEDAPATEGATEATETPTEVAAPATFEYTETPTLDMVPAGPVQVSANGRTIEIKTILFQPRLDTWSFQMSTGELERPTGMLPNGSETVNITGLPQELGVGTYSHTMDESGGGYFQIQQPDDPERTTSWNTRMAYHLQITAWDVAEYDSEASMFQVAGKASGKVVVTFRGSGDRFANSWAVGTFTDAPVRYMGKPRWVRDAEEAAAEAAE